jgi:hypothetical protein
MLDADTHKRSVTFSNSWKGDALVAMDAREQKVLIAELESLGFKWEESTKNHIKAVAPDGKTFTFSTGGTIRSSLNQRSLLKRWKRDNLPPEEKKEVETISMNNDDHGLVILEEMEPGVAFVAHDVANKTDLTKEQASNAITYLVAMGMLDFVERENGFSYRIPIEPEKEEQEVAQLSHAAVAALEAMVEAIRSELASEETTMSELSDEIATLTTANDALRSELQKEKTRATGLEKEVNRLREVEKTFLDIKKRMGLA